MKKRVVEILAEASNQAGHGEVQVATEGYDAVLVTVEAVGVNGTGLVLCPSPYRDVSWFGLVGGPLVPPNAGQVLRVGLGTGLAINTPVPEQLVVAMDAAGGQVSIRVQGVRFVEEAEPRPLRDVVERIERLLTLAVDLLKKR